MPDIFSSWNWLLIIAGAIMMLIELALGGFAGFDLVLIGSAFVLGGTAGFLFGNGTIGLIVTGVLCLAYIFLGRRWVRSRMRGPSLPSNIDAVIGRSGRVVVRIAKHEAGRIKLGDEEWRAVAANDSADPIETGTEVTVESVDGVTLYVR